MILTTEELGATGQQRGELCLRVINLLYIELSVRSHTYTLENVLLYIGQTTA